MFFSGTSRPLASWRRRTLAICIQFSAVAVTSLTAFFPAMALKPAGILLTGPPGIGKSTACRKVVELCQKQGARIEGFLTEEIREPRVGRVGFRLVGLGSAEGQTAPLARTGPEAGTGPRVGKYTVALAEFEALAIPILDKVLAATAQGRSPDEPPLVCVIDEIGKMELFSQAFVSRMRELMTARPSPMLITVAVKGDGFIAEAKRMRGFELVELSTDSRDAAPALLVAKLLSSSDLGDTKAGISSTRSPARWRARAAPTSPEPETRQAEPDIAEGGPVVVWLRNELRLADNPLLSKALELCSKKPLPERSLAIVICLSPHTFAPNSRTSFGSAKVGALRRRFLEESISDLQASLSSRGSRLFICDEAPEVVLPAMAHSCGAKVVLATREFCPEERSEEARCSDSLEAIGAKLRLLDSGGITTLFGDDDLKQIKVPSGDAFPDEFQDFYQKARHVLTSVSQRGLSDAPAQLPPPPTFDLQLPGLRSTTPSSSSSSHPASPPFQGGESAASRRLQGWIQAGGLGRYKAKFRSLLGDYSSRLSPHLALGCLSPRRLASEVLNARASSVHVDHYTYELCWRDFFRFAAGKFGSTLFRREGPLGNSVQAPTNHSSSRWQRDSKIEERWKLGRTGIPLIDASMRELVTTGYCGNLARQMLAAFLVEDLLIDWRVGADWFEEHLIDYDPHSNWGQWARSAGVVPTNEAKKRRVGGTRYYDLAVALPQGEALRYIRQWCPELSALPEDKLFAPWTSTLPLQDEPLGSPQLRRYFEQLPSDGGGGKGKASREKGEGKGSKGNREAKGAQVESGSTRRWQPRTGAT